MLSKLRANLGVILGDEMVRAGQHHCFASFHSIACTLSLSRQHSQWHPGAAEGGRHACTPCNDSAAC